MPNEPPSESRFSKDNNQNSRDNSFRNNLNQEDSIKRRYLEKNWQNQENSNNQNHQRQENQLYSQNPQNQQAYSNQQNPNNLQRQRSYSNQQNPNNLQNQQSYFNQQNPQNLQNEHLYSNQHNQRNQENQYNNEYQENYLNQQDYSSREDYQSYGENNEYNNDLHRNRLNLENSQNYYHEPKKVSKTAIEWDVVIATALLVIILTAILQRIFPSFAIFISLLLGLVYILIATKSKASLIKSIPLTFFVILAISAYFSL